MLKPDLTIDRERFHYAGQTVKHGPPEFETALKAWTVACFRIETDHEQLL